MRYTLPTGVGRVVRDPLIFCSLITVSEQFRVIFYGNPVLRINRSAACGTGTVSFWPKPFLPMTPRFKLFLLGLLGTSFFGNNFDLCTSIEVKKTVREYRIYLLPESSTL